MADDQGKAQAGYIEAPEEHKPLTFKACFRYLKGRVPTLKPPMRKAPNPFKALTLLNRQQWLFFAVCLISLLNSIIPFF
jgi:SHS family lactate transporter-like MFS transporter